MTRHPLVPTTLAGLLAALTLAATPVLAEETPRVDQRQAQQQQRIADGVASGELTRPEARRLQRQQRAIGQAEAQAKADGDVTRAERRRLHHLQDHASHAIARQKHDRQQRPAPGGPGTGANVSPGG